LQALAVLKENYSASRITLEQNNNNNKKKVSRNNKSADN